MNQEVRGSVVVAGHICLDIIPTFDPDAKTDMSQLEPGGLVHIGPAVMSTGGAAANTGLALHQLGVPTTIIGKIGNDLFGQAILDVLSSCNPVLTDGMVTTEDAASSYTIVISPPGGDRSFLHCPGANDTFGPEDVHEDALRGMMLFHFGYPPIMRRMYADGGHELTQMLRNVHNAGVATSLDLAHIDANSPAGQIDWRELLRMALREVDLFVPSLDEVYPILQPESFQQATQNSGNFMESVNAALLRSLADELIEMGAAIVCLKMGAQGIYLRTTQSPERLARISTLSLTDDWLNRELLAPAYAVEVVGTTGAGDCAIAGLLAGIVRGQTPEEALTSAVATGGANVEKADALSGVPSWDELQQRIGNEWPKLPMSLVLPVKRDNCRQDNGWQYDDSAGLWKSSIDSA